MLNMSVATEAAVRRASVGPPIRRASQMVPSAAALLINAVPSATPGPAPKSLTGTASRSNSSGPGWLTWCPV
jgi:hypothetical protein